MPESPYGYWLPPDISTHGADIDRLIVILHWFMGAVFVIWSVFLAYCLVRFRARPGHQATYKLPKAWLAIVAVVAIAVFEAILDIGLSVPAWARRNEFPDAADAMRVRVVAEQFAWNVHYPGKDGLFGRTAPAFVTAENLLGLDPNDPAGSDDFNAVNQLHVPVNKPVIVAGDFNVLWGDRELELFLAATRLKNANGNGQPSHPSRAPRRQLDYIFYSPDIHATEFQIPDIKLSDHAPLVCDFEIDPNGNGSKYH